MPVPFPVLVGVPRSGTTLLRLMLDAHPQLAIPPETGFLLGDVARAPNPLAMARTISRFPPAAPAWPDYGLDASTFAIEAARLSPSADVGAVLRLFYRLYAERFGKPRSGDKTPRYLQLMPRVAKTLPEAHFIHIIRDGRDVALSWRKTWFAPSRNIPHLVAEWAGQIGQARQAASGLQYLEIRYDHLLTSTAACLERICRFIELPYTPAMLDYHLGADRRLQEHGARFRADGSVVVSREQRRQQQVLSSHPPDPSRLGVWCERLSQVDKDACLQVAGPLLAEFASARAAIDVPGMAAATAARRISRNKP